MAFNLYGISPMNPMVRALYIEALKYHRVLVHYDQYDNTYHIIAVNPGTPLYRDDDRKAIDKVLAYYPYQEYQLEPQ